MLVQRHSLVYVLSCGACFRVLLFIICPATPANVRVADLSCIPPPAWSQGTCLWPAAAAEEQHSTAQHTTTTAQLLSGHSAAALSTADALQGDAQCTPPVCGMIWLCVSTDFVTKGCLAARSAAGAAPPCLYAAHGSTFPVLAPDAHHAWVLACYMLLSSGPVLYVLVWWSDICSQRLGNFLAAYLAISGRLMGPRLMSVDGRWHWGPACVLLYTCAWVICACGVQGWGAVSLVQLPLRPLLVCSLFAALGCVGWKHVLNNLCWLAGCLRGKKRHHAFPTGCWLGRCVPAATRVACVLLLTPSLVASSEECPCPAKLLWYLAVWSTTCRIDEHMQVPYLSSC